MTSLTFTNTGRKTLQTSAKEADVQKTCWAWLAQIYPSEGSSRATIQDYSYMVPNGTQLGGSHKGRARYMASLKAQGFRPGVSDIVIAYPTCYCEDGLMEGHFGAYIELKRDRSSYKGPAAIASAIRHEQASWLILMYDVGYYVAIAYGVEEFKEVVQSYLSGETQICLPDYINQE